MFWALTLISPLIYIYHSNNNKPNTFKNIFDVSFYAQAILLILHLLLYRHYSSLRGDSLFGGCYNCGPKYNFWLSALGNVLLLILTFKWKKLDFEKDTKTPSNDIQESNNKDQ